VKEEDQAPEEMLDEFKPNKSAFAQQTAALQLKGENDMSAPPSPSSIKSSRKRIRASSRRPESMK
jgi:hypothetical protein